MATEVQRYDIEVIPHLEHKFLFKLLQSVIIEDSGNTNMSLFSYVSQLNDYFVSNLLFYGIANLLIPTLLTSKR